MRTYKDKEELKFEINKSFEKYISEFNNIPESLKDKSVDEVDRTPSEKPCLSSWLDNIAPAMGSR